jgi:hypothetical protein
LPGLKSCKSCESCQKKRLGWQMLLSRTSYPQFHLIALAIIRAIRG